MHVTESQTKWRKFGNTILKKACPSTIYSLQNIKFSIKDFFTFCAVSIVKPYLGYYHPYYYHKECNTST